MPPRGPLRTDDGPACRICGCSQNNACISINVVKWRPHPGELLRQRREKVTCRWVPTIADDKPRALCSACAGQADDMAEVIERMTKLVGENRSEITRKLAYRIGAAAIARRAKRLREDAYDAEA
jgi:hypothetical protein